MSEDPQDDFDRTIGRLDRVLSEMMGYARYAKKRRESDTINPTDPSAVGVVLMDTANQQTLKHHAEDMEAAAKAILRMIGKDIQGTPQPEKYLDAAG